MLTGADFLSGLSAEANIFFTYAALIFLFNLAMSATFRAFALTTSSQAVAQVLDT